MCRWRIEGDDGDGNFSEIGILRGGKLEMPGTGAMDSARVRPSFGRSRIETIQTNAGCQRLNRFGGVCAIRRRVVLVAREVRMPMVLHTTHLPDRCRVRQSRSWNKTRTERDQLKRSSSHRRSSGSRCKCPPQVVYHLQGILRWVGLERSRQEWVRRRLPATCVTLHPLHLGNSGAASEVFTRDLIFPGRRKRGIIWDEALKCNEFGERESKDLISGLMITLAPRSDSNRQERSGAGEPLLPLSFQI